MTLQDLFKSPDRIGLLMLVVVIIATAATFSWTSQHYRQDETATTTFIDDSGYLHVLGLTLGRTTLAEAEGILKSRSDIALYIYPQEHPQAGRTLEAFFPAITDHTKVILLLSAEDTLLASMESRATLPHLYPNTVARMNLASVDIRRSRQLPIQALTLIPNLTLTAATLKQRFGSPDRIIDSDAGELQYFDRIALTALIDKQGQARLTFTMPMTAKKRPPF